MYDVCMYLPTHTINKPVAKGSNVPAWPIFLNCPRFFNFLTTSNEVQNLGLFIR